MSNDRSTETATTTVTYAEQPDAESPAAGPDDDARLDQAARIELLEEENRRLRAEYARARQARYRRTAIGLAAIGLAALLGAVLFPASREVFVAFGATGLFGALLTYYLTPERVVAATVGERVYAAAAANGAALATELGLRDDRLYLPESAAGGARLYIPAHREYELPTAADGPVVLDGASRGLLVEPTGAPLVREVRRTVAGELASAPAPLADQLCEALVEQFELAGAAEPEVDAAGDRVTVAITDSAFGDVDRFDHPIASVLAVGLAGGLDRPVALSVARGDARADWLVTCRLDAAATDADGPADTPAEPSTATGESTANDA